LKVAYVDTSCLVAVAFGEPQGRGMASRLEEFERLLSSNLLEAELRTTFQREGVGETPEEMEKHLSRFLAAINWIYPDRRLTPEFRQALAHGILKGSDLWHLACALFVAPDPQKIDFLTLDAPQRAVAERLGFSV